MNDRKLLIPLIAERLGVKPDTVRAYNSRGQMPPPTGQLGRTPYWVLADVQPWIDDVLARRADRARGNESKEK